STLTETVNSVTTKAGTISGRVMEDKTCNGPSGDDKPMSGVYVLLYRDKNGNGKVDGSDGLPVDIDVTDAKGAYSFANVKAGNYLVQQAVPCGYKDLTPKGDTYAVTIGNGGSASSSASNLDFLDQRKSGNGRDLGDLGSLIGLLGDILKNW